VSGSETALAIASRVTAGATTMGIGEGSRSAVAVAGVRLDDAGDDVALDELALLPGGLAEGGGGEAIEVTHGAGSRLVQERDRIGREQVAFAAGVAEAHAEVLRRVVGEQRFDLESMVEGE
jgi:hypothetical protein